MIPKIDIRSNIREVVAEFRADASQAIDKATVAALNRTMVTARAISARELKKDYGQLPIRVIKGQMRITRASSKKLRAVLTFANRRIRLIRYGVFATPRGIRGAGLPKRLMDQDGQEISRADLAHAFIRRSRNRGVWNVMKRATSDRYPLQIVLAPSLAESVVEGGIYGGLRQAAIDQFEKTLRQEINFRLAKGK